MKKIATTVLAGTLALSMLSGCSKEQTTQEKNETPINEETSQAQPITEEMSSMAAPIDALIRTMSAEEDSEYDPSDNLFFWNALAFMAANIEISAPRAEQVDETHVMITEEATQEMASALFADYSDLLQLPEEADGVTYSEENEAYLFEITPEKTVKTNLVEYVEEDGVYTVTAELLPVSDTDTETEPISTWEVTMTENTYADGITDPIYLYSVSDIKLLSSNVETGADTITLQSITEDGMLKGKTEDGTEITLRIANDDTLSLLKENYKEGDTLTVLYQIDPISGEKTITNVDVQK